MKYFLSLLLIFFSNILTCQEEIEELDFLFPGDSIPLLVIGSCPDINTKLLLNKNGR